MRSYSFRRRPHEPVALRRPVRCGMMIGCAAATCLSGCDERVRVTAASSGERPGQGGGDLGAAPPDHCPGAAAGKARPRFSLDDRAFLAALLHRHPRDVLGRFRLLVRPETVLRWHRDLLARCHAARSRPRRPGRPRIVRSIRLLVLRLARENPCWGYRRIHGELLVLGIKVAASTVWEILQQAGIDPAPERTSATWASFLRSQAGALLACDFFETVTLAVALLLPKTSSMLVGADAGVADVADAVRDGDLRSCDRGTLWHGDRPCSCDWPTSV